MLKKNTSFFQIECLFFPFIALNFTGMENQSAFICEQSDFRVAGKAPFAAWIASVYLFTCGT
mgnify:FL=1